MPHECTKEEFLGQVKEFMINFKDMNVTTKAIVIAIITQIAVFLVMWGGLITTVKQNVKDIDRILAKLDSIKIVYAQEE